MTPTSQVALLDHYAVLGVSSSATAADIGRAYRSQARTLHPDKYVDNTDPPHASFQQLLHAYTVLSDTNQRQLYDEQRSAAELSVSSAVRAQLWTDVLWTELDYSPPQQPTEAGEEEGQEAEEQLGEYGYVCKCGYRYTVSEVQLDRLLDEEDTEVKEICVSCESCSLGVRITAGER